MARVTSTVDREKEYMLAILQLLASIYFSLLLVAANAVGTYSWPTKLRFLYVAHRYPGVYWGIDDNDGVSRTAFFLVWGGAALVFLLLRLFARFSGTKTLLRALIGMVLIVGFPVACMHAFGGRFLFLEVELAIIFVCTVLYAYRRLPLSGYVALPLLALHFGVWWFFNRQPWPAELLFWPRWHWVWRMGSYATLLYVLIGLCAAVIWGIYIKRVQSSEDAVLTSTV